MVSSSSGNFKPITLITFDVDGTLVRSNPEHSHDASLHGKAFLHAVGKVFGNESNFEDRYHSPTDILPHEKYHGSTDGLIALNLAKALFDVDAPTTGLQRLPEIFQVMQEFFSRATDHAIASCIAPIPGVLHSLESMQRDGTIEGNYLCGLVTGNVEGIARKKMRACGIYQTKILSRKAEDQNWQGEDDVTFLGGFGSDHCSGDINNPAINHIDRAEQISIAYRRGKSLLQPHEKIVRVVHVGDAPSDVLAAKYCYEQGKFDDNVVVGCIGVGTGAYSCKELEEIAGISVEGLWEPVILAEGIPHHDFVVHCKIEKNR